MRILQIAPVPPDIGGANTGGIATHAWGLATHLAARGHDVAVAADNRAATSGASLVEDVRVFGVYGYSAVRSLAALRKPRVLRAVLEARRRLGAGWNLLWIVRSVAAYEAAIVGFQPAVVHVHALEGRFAIIDALVGDRAVLVATVHSTHYFEHAEPEAQHRRRGLVERNLASARRLIFVSRYLEARYSSLFPASLEGKRVAVIPNPIDASLYAPSERGAARRRLGIEDARHVLLFAGNLIARKAPLAFVSAVAGLRDRGLDVLGIMVGEGPEQGLVGERVRDLGLDSAIRLEGFRQQADLADYYSSADVFVLPSLMESFGLVALEAMLCGCPVVGTPEVLPEVVPPDSGICIESFEIPALVEALEDALSRDWDRAAIRQRVLASDWALRVGDWEGVYAEAVSGERS